MADIHEASGGDNLVKATEVGYVPRELGQKTDLS